MSGIKVAVISYRHNCEHDVFVFVAAALSGRYVEEPVNATTY